MSIVLFAGLAIVGLVLLEMVDPDWPMRPR